MKKNVASQVVGAQMITAADGTAFTGSVTCYVTGDGGTQAAGSVGSGACTHEGNGFHTYAPAQAETNYDHVAFTFIGTGAIPVTVQIYPGFPQTGDNYARLGAPAGASVAADIAAVKSDTAAILTDTGTSGVLISAGTGSGQLDVTSGRIKADTVYFGGAAGTFASGRPEVNATHFGGTAGTFSIGAGILDVNAQYLQGDTPVTTVATGVYESDPAVYNTASTFGALFNSVLADTNELQTDWADGGRLDLLLDGASSAGDPWTTSLPGAYTGTQAGKILSDILTDTGTTLQAELDGIQADTEDIQSRLPAALVGGRMDASVGAMAANVVTAASTAADFITEIQTAAAAALTAYDTGGGVAKQTTIEDLATEVAAILVDTGTTLPATLTTIANYLDTEIAAILEDTGTTLPAQISALSIPTANQIADALLIRDVDNVEASAPEHSLTTVILACLEMSISGSTMTIKRTDGSTTHVTKTLTTDGDATPITGIA